LPNNATAIYGGHGYNQDYANATLPGPDSGFPCCRFNFHMAGRSSFKTPGPRPATAGWRRWLTADGRECYCRRPAGADHEDTSYPFEEQIRLRLSVSNSVAFPLKVRIPGWCSNATVTVNGQLQSGVVAGTFLTLSNAWNNGDLVTLNFR